MATVFYYQLTSKANEELFYIGYTVNCEENIKSHTSLLNSNNDRYLYRKLREVGGGFTFTIIKEGFTDDKDEMREEKRSLCYELKPTLNGMYVGNLEKRQKRQRENDKDDEDWERKITIFLNDLKKNPPIKRGGMFVMREYITDKDKIRRHTVLIYNDDIMITDIPSFPLKDTNGNEIM